MYERNLCVNSLYTVHDENIIFSQKTTKSAAAMVNAFAVSACAMLMKIGTTTENIVRTVR